MYESAIGLQPEGYRTATLGDQPDEHRFRTESVYSDRQLPRRAVATRIGLALAGLAVAAAASQAGSILTFPYVVIAIAGLGLNVWAVMRLESSARLAHGARRELVQFQTLTLDIVSVFFLAILLATSGILQNSTAIAVAVIYVVFLLCALIKCYALKKIAYPKLYRAGKLVKFGACLVIVAKLTQQDNLIGFAAFSLDLPNLMVVAATLLTVATSVKHAARVRALLALRDPRPSAPATIATVA